MIKSCTSAVVISSEQLFTHAVGIQPLITSCLFGKAVHRLVVLQYIFIIVPHAAGLFRGYAVCSMHHCTLHTIVPLQVVQYRTSADVYKMLKNAHCTLVPILVIPYSISAGLFRGYEHSLHSP